MKTRTSFLQDSIDERQLIFFLQIYLKTLSEYNLRENYLQNILMR